MEQNFNIYKITCRSSRNIKNFTFNFWRKIHRKISRSIALFGVCFQENVIANLLSNREHFHLLASFRGVSDDDLEDEIDNFAFQA
jgi:ABC-type multidrug transport system ATPase subunit